MKRRGFLQALFAIPVIAAPLLIPGTLDPVRAGLYDNHEVLICTEVIRANCAMTFTSMTHREACERYPYGYGKGPFFFDGKRFA